MNYGLLETHGHLERLNNAIQTNTLKLQNRETEKLIEVLLKYGNVKSRDAVASLPVFSAFTTLLELPIMPANETGKAMQFQLKQYIPLPIASVAVDWIKVGERQNEQGVAVQQVLLVSIPNEHIQKYKNIFRNAGLNLVALELEGFSSARALTSDSDQVALIIDIGSRSTMIAVAKRGFLKFVGQTDFAGGSLTQTIAAGLNIKPHRAEDLKKLRGLRGGGGEYELSTLMLPILDVIISEAGRVKNNYEERYKEKIERIILAGGGANLLGIVPYAQERFGLPAEKAFPFARLKYPSEIEPLIRELAPEFTVAVGLGIKPLISI